MKTRYLVTPHLTCIALIVLLLGGCGGGSTSEPLANQIPAGVRVMESTTNDASNDLLTAGVGVPTQADPTSTLLTYADPSHPTAPELRRAAIETHFDKGAGEGVLWGTGFDPITQKPVVGDGKVTGKEILAYYDDGTGTKNVGMFVDIPDAFDVNNPCVLVVAPASAARLFNDTYLVSWGLRRNCAVASTDKGGGNGVHDLTSNSVVLLDGTIADADAAGKDSSFTAPNLTGAARTDFLAKYPNRISLKYYGKRNPMAEQGDDVLMAAKFALSELNEVYGIPLANGTKSVRFTKDNTITILVGVSSGGGGAMMGAEKDIDGYFSGVVAFEPAVNPAANPKVSVTRAGKTFQSTGTSILDFISMENIYMPCAGRADSTWPGYANLTTGDAICASLHDKGLVAGATPADQANDAVRKLLNYGFDPAGTWEYPTNGDLAGPQHAIANAYMQTGVERVLCGITAALTVDARGIPTAPTTTQLAQMWVTTGTYNPMPIYEESVGGPVRSTLAVSPSTGRADSGLDGKLCLQAIKTGTSAESDTYRAGELAAGHTGNLHGKPTILMQGREDVRLPATLTSRMYAGLNSVVEGPNSKLHFYEVTNIAHAGGTPARLVPVQYYAYTALSWMWNHLKNGTPLPPNQVIRTFPRGTNPDGSARDLTVNGVPPPVANPRPADSIAVTNGAVTIPD